MFDNSFKGNSQYSYNPLDTAIHTGTYNDIYIYAMAVNLFANDKHLSPLVHKYVMVRRLKSRKSQGTFSLNINVMRYVLFILFLIHVFFLQNSLLL